MVSIIISGAARKEWMVVRGCYKQINLNIIIKNNN